MGRTMLRMLLLAGLVLAMLPATSAMAASQAIEEPEGRLTRTEISDELNCAVNHIDDAEGEFFGDTACGTFVATGGTLYGPTEVPAGGSASPRSPFTVVSQSGVTGSGTSSDPYRIVTVVDLAGENLRLTETDTYIRGEESYRTDVQFTNTSNAGISGLLYRAGDCFLQNSDTGFGRVDPDTGAVACVAQNEDGTAPGDRIEQWLPLTPGSHSYEARYSEVWARIGAQQPFDDTCECDELQDNGAGLSWDFSVAPSAAPPPEQPPAPPRTTPRSTDRPSHGRDRSRLRREDRSTSRSPRRPHRSQAPTTTRRAPRPRTSPSRPPVPPHRCR